MTETPLARRSRLTPERQAELYTAVLDLLRRVGYDALTMDAVASRCGASKATLYRQWGGKARLVATALHTLRPSHGRNLDTGSLRGDLRARVKRESESAREQKTALLRALVVAVQSNADLKEALRRLLMETEIAELRLVLQRAVERGELRADNPAVKYVPLMFLGCAVSHSLFGEAPLTQELLISFIDAVILPALGMPASEQGAT
ncbi:TetR/AcrR family transcriptional regulator [Streptomyces sp. NPDC051985]|uniref:TetR/AcrR family transcriptional regulator n=1 Tax=Streptomyces sp. NPDC051985 TaxID=3155807 RepID=UPI003421566E